MIKYGISGIIVFFIFFAVYLFIHLGAYKSVDMNQSQKEPLYFVYLVHYGPYHQILESIQKVENWAKANKVVCDKTFGEFLDDPAMIEPERLKSHVGCVLEQPINLTLPENFFYDQKPAGNYVEAQFEGAPSVGPIKVYPKIKEYIQENRLETNGAPIEIYSNFNQQFRTQYLFRLKP